MSINRFFIALATLFASFSLLHAQEVAYKILDEGPRLYKFQVGIDALHTDMMFDMPENITAGAAVYGSIHLGKRIGFNGRYYLPVYKSGRNSFEAGGFLAYTSKDLESTIRVNLRSSGYTTTYINVPVTRIKQNRLRYGLSVVSTDQMGSILDEAAGINVPEALYRTRSQMFHIGLGRFFGSFVQIDANEYGKKKSGFNYTIFADILIQGATLNGKAELQGEKYEVTPAGEYSPLGARVGIEMENQGGLFPFEMYVRYGWRPGFVQGDNAALEFGMGIPIFRVK